MRGERDLRTLLRSLSPWLDPVTYWFCQVPPSWQPDGLPLLARLEEVEGSTIVLTAGHGVEAGLTPSFVARRIVLTVHSDFAAVGMMAAVSSTLASHGVPCNVLAGVYHDHLFVGEDDALLALALLRELQRSQDDGVSVHYLSRYAPSIPVVAAWHHAEWQHLLPGWTVEEAAAELASHGDEGTIPTTLVAVSDGEVIGTASLLLEDMPGTEQWSPWLASVYVTPAWRGKGIGKLLVDRAIGDAARLGVSHLHLFTTDAEAWYLEQGWRVRGQMTYAGRSASIMDLDLRRERSTFQQDEPPPWRRSMSEWSDRWQAILTDFERQRDELKVRVHLAKAEAREEMVKLEEKMDILRQRAMSAGSEAKDALKDIGGAAEQLANEIRIGLDRIRKTL